MINLAILSPNQYTYSETFIRAHKRLPFNNKFYYGGLIPSHLEGEGVLLQSRLRKIYYHLRYRLQRKLNPTELALTRSLKKNNINIVLAEFGITAAESLAVVKSLKIPLIAHFHGADASEKSILERYYRKYQELFSYATAVVVVSKKMKLALLQLGCSEEKLFLNTYGPQPFFSEITPNYSSRQFVAIGRFVDKKAPYATIMAFKKAHEKHPDINLVMGGDGPLLNTCKNLVKLLNIEKAVSFSGILKPEEVKDLFRNSIAFIQHSIVANNGDSEGTPVGILEAQASGLPVISTYHAGIPDVVIHNETGLLSDELDIDTMSKHIMYIAENSKRAEIMGSNSKLRIEADFSLEKHLRLLEELIRNSIKN